MATIGLTPSDGSTRRRYKKYLRRSARENGYFTVTAQHSISLRSQHFEPGVPYSLKKLARWQLLDTVGDTAQDTAQQEPSKRIEVTVANAVNRREGQQFYGISPNNVIEISQSNRKRRKRLNIQSLHSMMKSSESEEENMIAVDFLATSRSSKKFEKKKTKLDAKNCIHTRKLSSSRRRDKLNVFIKAAAKEVEEEEEWDEEEDVTSNDDEVFPVEQSALTLENFIAPNGRTEAKKNVESAYTPDESHKNRQLPLPPNFVAEEPSEAATTSHAPSKTLQDRVEIHLAFVSLPMPSVIQLGQLFSPTEVVPGPSPSLCAINISEMLRSRARMPRLPLPGHLQAYILLEDVVDGINVRLNCQVDESTRNISLPPLDGCGSIREVVETCVEFCAVNYPSAMISNARQTLLTISGFRIPLDPQLSMRMETIDSVWKLKENSKRTVDEEEMEMERVCGICFDLISERCASLDCGHEFCSSCWKLHLLSELGAGRDPHCPAFACQEAVDLVFRLRHLSVPVLKRHFLMRLSDKLEGSADIIWCPNLTCGRPIRLRGYSRQSTSIPVNAHCCCNAEFCADCGQEGHWPASCQSYQQYTAKLRRLGDWKPLWNLSSSLSSTIIKTKSCPKCGRHWEKGGGCNDMVCSKCLARYCWNCGIEVHEHGVRYPCMIGSTNEEYRLKTRVIHSQYGDRREISEQRSSDYCEALHFRMMSVSASMSLLKRNFGRPLRRAVGGDRDWCKLPADAVVLSLLRALAQCLRSAQFSLVATMTQTSRERAGILRCFAGRFECLAVPAMDALDRVKENENAKSREIVVKRLRDCQDGGWRAARMLQAILIGWSKEGKESLADIV